MLKKEIINNLNRNYLRMECEANENMNKYEYKMMNVDNIVGLLPCHVRFINGISYLYYEITATTTLATVYQNQTLKKEDLKKIIQAIDQTIHSLETYLLQGENIVFDPEFIFMDSHTGEIFFIYYPYYGSMNKGNFLKFVEFLTQNIDHDDEDLVEKIYQLYEQVAMGSHKIPLKEMFELVNSDALVEATQEEFKDDNILEYVQPEEDLKLVMEERVEEKEKPLVLSLFEFKKGKIRQKRISYAVEEGSMKEAFGTGYDSEG